MVYEIKRRETRWGPSVPVFDVYVDNEGVGSIQPLFKTLNSDRPYGYHTYICIEYDALTDDSGFPNEYRTQREAFAAVADMMERNGIEAAAR